MEPWGAALYGDPCAACGYDWSRTPAEAVDWIDGWAGHLTAATAGADGAERHPDGGWSVTEYVCHVGDNLRQWSERLQSALLARQRTVAGYDPDALHENVELEHATRGPQTAADVARNNCHDAYHHLWDVRQILASAR